MKRFIDYLNESKDEYVYSFMIKVAGDLPDHCEETMESVLQKYNVKKFSKVKTTPIQTKISDFPTLENVEVTIFEVDLEYPVTSTVLTSYLAEQTGMSAEKLRVRSAREEAESELNAEHQEADEKKKPLLSQDYEKTNFQNIVGEKGVSNFLKDLAKVRKEHQPTQYKGVNDSLLAKKSPQEKSSETVKAEKSFSTLGNRSMPNPKGTKK